MPNKNQDRNPEDFWREYEEKTNDKVLAKCMGRYISGWEDFDSKEWKDLWGLVIICEKGFRFHHFPQQSWLKALVIHGENEKSDEKIIFIPKETIISAGLHTESRWWAKIFSNTPPQLTINYRDGAGNEKRVFFAAEIGHKELEGKLNELSSAGST